MTPQPGSRWMGLAFMGVGLAFGLAAGAVIFFGRPAAGLAPVAPTMTAGPSAPAPVEGAPAPDFTLQTPAGVPVTLSALRGQIVLVNFWATWCGPCEAEMPTIQDRYARYRDRNFTVLAVNLAEPVAEVQAFVERLGLTFSILLDPQETVFDQYRVRGYPTTFIVDAAGLIRTQHVGYMSDSQLDEYLLAVGLASQ